MKTMALESKGVTESRWISGAAQQWKKGNISVTRDEIERFWRRKKVEEEDHLLSALKAAARIKICSLTVEEYERFEEALRNSDDDGDKKTSCTNGNELRVGIKDWLA